MNRKLISKALNGIEETYLVECMTYRGKRGQAPERNPKMGKYENTTVRPHSRRLLALILAACLIFALATTAYAANLFGLKEMFKTYNRELPEAADPYIQTQTEAAQAEDWSCRISESLCDLGKVLTTIVVSGGDEHGNAAVCKALFQRIDALCARIAVKEVACQQHKAAALPAADLRHFAGKKPLLLPQKLPLLLREGGEGGIQVPVRAV